MTGAAGVPYPEELLDRIRTVKGDAAEDEIARDLDPNYVELWIRYAVLSYVHEDVLVGRRLLDFGCGGGASTAVLSRLFPGLSIVGVELEPDLLSIAELRRRHYGLDNVQLLLSPRPDQIPEGLGTFDHVMMSAVYEHLLPGERGPLMRLLWDVLRPGGILFLNQTPHRWYPLEFHTSGLPFVNYLPAPLAHAAASRLTRRRIHRGASWPELRRRGIRGGTPRGILRHLPADARLLRPSRLDVRDQADIWYAVSSTRAQHWRKPVLRRAYRLLHVTPDLHLAIRKSA